MSFEKVKEIMEVSINCDGEAISMDARLKEDLSIDSLDAMELNMALEEEFKISIADEDLMSFVTVKDIVDYIDKQVA